MVRIGERVEFVSRDQPKKLTEDRAMIGQGLVPRCGSMVSRNSIVPSYERTKPLLLQSLWDSSDSDPDFKIRCESIKRQDGARAAILGEWRLARRITLAICCKAGIWRMSA